MLLAISGWTLMRSAPWAPEMSPGTVKGEGRIGPIPPPSPPPAPTSPWEAARRPLHVRAQVPLAAKELTPAPAPLRRTPIGQVPQRLYRIQFGPTRDLHRVEAFVERLSHSYGIVGRILTESVPSGYRVLSGPAPSSTAAEQRAGLLTTLGIPSRVISAGGRYRLAFGRFPTEEEAEALSRRVRRYGFTAIVEPDYTAVYRVVVRRVPQTTAVEIVQRLWEEGFALSLRAERQ